ncbi:glycogen synthase GlgA [candidate division KSB1 bacterium]|nr:glycogen synthase GlgA [candidate division KSB1 bacterium]
MQVLIVTSEMVPYSKTGGLADVLGALPAALAKLDCEVSVFLPYYSMTEQMQLPVTLAYEAIPLELGFEKYVGNILRTQPSAGVTVYLVQQHQFYDREFLYGTPQGDYPDNAKRFIFFNKMALRFCELSGFAPDIIHCHDWQAGLIPVYLKANYQNHDLFRKTATIFTIHNIAYQGIFELSQFGLTGLPDSVNTVDGLEFWGKMNFMKAGINFSDYISTVSRKYSEEIQTPEYGYGIDGVLRNRKHRCWGIVNGVDYDIWNPAVDQLIAANYSIESLAAKRTCKIDLLNEFHFAPELAAKPLLGVISRLADQKGFDLLSQIMPQLMARGVTFVLLGTGDQKYHDLFHQFAQLYPQQVGVRLAFDNRLAHKIEAGADIFLMPSRYEPCGLNQIYSLKYGTIPVVRATGGLDDTIQQFDVATGQGTGFKFTPYTSAAFLAAIDAALQIYADAAAWQRLMQQAMQADFSWDHSAREYRRLYDAAHLEKR